MPAMRGQSLSTAFGVARLLTMAATVVPKINMWKGCMRIAAIVMLAGVGSGAWGQEVYKCPKDGGGLAFQDHPCAGAKYEHDTPRPPTPSLATAGTSGPLVSIATPPQAHKPAQSGPGNKRTVDLPVDTLDPPQRVLKGSPVWVSADQVVVTAFQDHAEVEFPEENSKCQVLLINTTKRSIRAIADNARVIGFNSQTKALLVARSHWDLVADAKGGNTSKTSYFDLRELRVRPDDTVVVEKNFPAGSAPPDPTSNFPKQGLFTSMPEPQDGYLLRVVKPGDSLQAQDERASATDDALATVWIRPNLPPTPITVRFDEVTDVRYVGFLDKFQLSHVDAKQVSLARDRRKVWRRPYDFPPYRLLGRDGHVEEIPYPSWLGDYGLQEPQRRDGGGYDFSSLSITRPGLLIRKDFGHDANYFLYKDAQLYRLMAAAGNEGSPRTTRPLVAYSTWLEPVSPDGCKVAFTHQRVEMAGSTRLDGYYLSVIDLCKVATAH